MDIVIPTNNVPITLLVGVRTKEPTKVALRVRDNRKPSTYYINRSGVVDGKREFELKLPQSPKAAVLSVYNMERGNFPKEEDGTVGVTKIEPIKLKECPIWMKPDTRSFVKLAQEFSESASILSAGVRKPHIYRSDDAKFSLDYYDIIRDKKTGRELNTPARIGHNTGIIEVSKKHFMGYTVPMRMIILLHEYAHKYLNPNINKPIDYETGADINAANIYLSLGYSEVEALRAFLKVFKGANNAQNDKRFLILQDFITKFHNGEFGECGVKIRQGRRKRV